MLRWCVIILLYVLAETALISFVNLYLFEYRGAPERVAIQAIAWFWAIMLVGRLLCSILPVDAGRPQADRRRHAQRCDSHPADHPHAGLAGRFGGNPDGLVPDGRNLADHHGHDGTR